MSKWQRVMSFVFFALIIGATVTGSPIKNWTSGEYVTYTDLNATLNHLHANLGHGHGPIITAADISPSAGIKPEQTTFGSSINRSLVHVGTWMRNPDAGVYYIPINKSGSLDITVARIGNGAIINAAATTGALADGGTQLYTVFANSIGGDAGSILCVNNVDPVLGLSLSYIVYCDGIHGTPAVGGIDPPGLAIQVFNNKVQ